LALSTEADTCRKCALPKLVDAGWDKEPHSFTEQRTFTDGRIVISGNKVRRKKQKRADYLLRHTADFPIAVVEAKADYKKPADGLQQAKEYAQILDLKFAYPPLPEQRRIVGELDTLQAKVDGLKRLQGETAAELDALLPSILDKAFKGEL
jgi:hypothetical protein